MRTRPQARRGGELEPTAPAEARIPEDLTLSESVNEGKIHLLGNEADKDLCLISGTDWSE